MRRLVALAPLLAVLACLAIGPFCASALASPGGGSAADSQYFDPLHSPGSAAGGTRTVKLEPAADRSASLGPAQGIAIGVGAVALVVSFACGIVIGKRRRRT